MKRFLPIFIGIGIILAFYHPYFTKKLVPVPLDIITGMYLPWLDLSRDIFPNGGPVKNPLPSDVVSLTLPLRFLSVNILKHGEFPLINQNILLGTPLFANFQSAILNPVNILYWLPFSFIDIWSVQIIIQPILAFIFFYLYVSQYLKNGFSKTIGSLIWALNGFFILWFQYNTVVYSALYLPLILYGIDKLTKNYNYGLLISFGVVFSIFSGNPPVTMIIIGASFLYTYFKYYEKIRIFFISILFFCIGFIFSFPQLLPGIIGSQDSIRNYDRVAEKANIKYLPIEKLITITNPDYFGHPSTRNFWKNQPSYDNTTIYNGILPIILLTLSIFVFGKKGYFKIIYYFYSLILLSLLIMLPNPLSLWLGKINFLGLSSMVFTRISVLISFSMAFISSFVIEELLQNKISTKTVFKSALYVLISVTTIFLITYFINQNYQKLYLIDYDWKIQSQTSLRNSILPIVLSALYLFLISIFTVLRKKIFRYPILLLLFSIMLFDQYRFFYKYNSFTSKINFYPNTIVSDYLEKNSFRFARESAEIMPSNMWLMYDGLKSPSGYDTTYSQRYGGLISLINGGSLNDHPNRYLEIDNFSSKIIDQLSIDHILVTKKDKTGLSDKGNIPTTLQQKKYSLIKDYGRYQLLKNNASLPFIYPVKKIIKSSSPKDTEKLLLAENSSDYAIIENDINYPNIIDFNVKIDKLSLKSQSFSFQTISNSNLPYFLRISQNFDPNWIAIVDNQPKQTLVTNYALTGLLLSPGNHEVQFVYQTKIFNNSVFVVKIVGILTLVIIVIKILWKIIKQN